MSKYPKAWAQAVKDACVAPELDWNLRIVSIFDALSEAGALKEPPKPREYEWCQSCNYAIDWMAYPGGYKNNPSVLRHRGACQGELIHVIEVLDE